MEATRRRLSAVEQVNAHYRQTLINGAKNNDIQKVREALLFGADVNTSDENGDTALLLAIRHGHEDITHCLINDYRADPSIANKHYQAPLHIAIRQGNLQLFHLLLNASADIEATDKDGNTPLLLATREQNTDMCAELLNRQANPNQCNHRLQHPVHEAMTHEGTDILTNLLKANANADCINAELQKPIDWAITDGKKLNLLLKHGAQVNKDLFHLQLKNLYEDCHHTCLLLLLLHNQVTADELIATIMPTKKQLSALQENISQTILTADETLRLSAATAAIDKATPLGGLLHYSKALLKRNRPSTAKGKLKALHDMVYPINAPVDDTAPLCKNSNPPQVDPTAVVAVAAEAQPSHPNRFFKRTCANTSEAQRVQTENWLDRSRQCWSAKCTFTIYNGHNTPPDLEKMLEELKEPNPLKTVCTPFDHPPGHF